MLLSGRSTVNVYGLSSSSAQPRHLGVLHVNPANFVLGTNYAPLPKPAICSAHRKSYARAAPILIAGAGQAVMTISFLQEYDGLFDHLLSRGILHIDGGLVSIGPEAERLWGGRNYMELLSVFDTPELFTVMFGPHELGVLHEMSCRRLASRRARFESFRLLCPEEKAHDDPP